MKVSGANPVHALFTLLRERTLGAQKLPGAMLRPDALEQVRGPVKTVKSPDIAEDAPKVDAAVAAPNDDATTAAVARLRSNISFVAADGVNKLSQFESGRSWERAPIDLPASPPPPELNPRTVQAESATRFTPSQADIREAMDILAALNSRKQLYGDQSRLGAKSDLGWKQIAGRVATIFLGVSILIAVLSTL
jgi:hypothetical protein